jgi:hypothetical protein
MEAANDNDMWTDTRLTPLTGPTQHIVHMTCPVTQQRFLLTNKTKMAAKDVTEASTSIVDSIICRRLANKDTVDTFFCGKGYDIQTLQYAREYWSSRESTLKTTRPTPDKVPGEGWCQLRTEVKLFNEVSTAPVLRSETLFSSFFKHGLRLSVTSEWELHRDSVRLQDFIPQHLNFKPTASYSNPHEHQGLKLQMSLVVQLLEHTHVLVRSPAIFWGSCLPIVEALKDTSHEVNKDIYSVPSLVWLLELGLAKFYRCIRYADGRSDVHLYRRIFYETVVQPFVNIDPQVPVQYALYTKMHPPKTTEKNENGKSTTSSDAVCRFYLANYLNVPFVGTTRIPECNYIDEPLCPHGAHPPLSDASVQALEKMVHRTKTTCVGPCWTQLYKVMLTTVEARK